MTTALAEAPSRNGGAIIRSEGVTLGDMLLKRRDLIASVLPKHLTPERLIKLATVAVARDAKLSKATGLSVVNAVIKAAELGLDCSGTLGSAYLVAYDNNKKDAGGNWTKVTEAQLIIGYRGLIDLARRSGQIASIEARVVWERDEFDFEYGLEPRLKHKPVLDGDPGPLKLVYGVAKLRDGAVQIEVMTRADIDKIKGRSKSATSDKSPWHTDYSEMARKTVVKRLCKYLPLSVEVQEAIAVDNASDPIDLIDGGQSAAERLKAKLVSSKPVSEGKSFVPDDGAEQAIAAQDAVHGEVIDTQTGEVSEPDVSGIDSGRPDDLPPSLGTHEALIDALNAAAMGLGLSPSSVGAWWKSYVVSKGVKGKEQTQTPEWRAAALADYVAAHGGK